MKRYFDYVIDRGGSAVKGASIRVIDTDDNDATLYSDNGTTPTDNPVKSDENGLFSFYVADGDYTLQISYNDASITIPDVEIYDDTTNRATITNMGMTPALDYYEATDGNDLAPAFNRAIDAVSARGGGEVVFPNKGSVAEISDTIVFKSNVQLIGVGRPRLKLANGVNKTMIQSEDFLTLSGTNSGSGVSNCSIRNFFLDCNRANNASAGTNEGHGIAIYGRDIVLEDLYVFGSRRRGIHTEYGNSSVGTSPFNGRMRCVTTDSTGEEGWFNKLSDLHADDINIRSPSQNSSGGFDGIYLGASGGIRGAKINVWRGGSATETHRYAVNCEASGTTLDEMHLETASTASLRIGTNRCLIGGLVSYNLVGSAAFHAIVDGSGNQISMAVQNGGVSGEATTAYGVKLGDANIVSGNDININMSGHSGGLVNFANSGGGNQVNGRIFRPSGGAFWTGTPHATDTCDMTATGATAAEEAGFSKKAGASASLSPVGTTQSGAAPLRRTVERVYTTSTSNVAVLLPPATHGDHRFVVNIGTQTISVFPSGSNNIHGLSASAADTIAAGARKLYVAHSSTEWGAY